MIRDLNLRIKQWSVSIVFFESVPSFISFFPRSRLSWPNTIVNINRDKNLCTDNTVYQRYQSRSQSLRYPCPAVLTSYKWRMLAAPYSVPLRRHNKCNNKMNTFSCNWLIISVFLLANWRKKFKKPFSLQLNVIPVKKNVCHLNINKSSISNDILLQNV